MIKAGRSKNEFFDPTGWGFIPSFYQIRYIGIIMNSHRSLFIATG